MSETRQEIEQNERLALIEMLADPIPCGTFRELSSEFFWLCETCYRSEEDHKEALALLKRQDFFREDSGG